MIQVAGGNPLYGEIQVQGSKNAVLPIMAASLLYEGTTVIENVPKIQDVYCMMGILRSLGCKVSMEGHTVLIDASALSQCEICREDMEKMRSSILLAGPLLARLGEAGVYYPGGCSIGKRPIDLHFSVFRALGANVEEAESGKWQIGPGENKNSGARICVKAADLLAAAVHLPYPSVGATENGILTAVGARGVTVLKGCAREPEIVELVHFLRKMGVCIRGEGTSRIEVEGQKALTPVRYRVGADRIAAGTYLAAAMCAGGDVRLCGVSTRGMEPVLPVLRSLGAVITQEGDSLRLQMGRRPKGGVFRQDVPLKTAPFPGFPTDMQSLLLAVFAVADGENCMEETVFEGRFAAARQLLKFGAEILVEGNRVCVTGVPSLRGASVHAPDLRGGAALVAAALAADGCSQISGYEHIARGYEDICGSLRLLGADICISHFST
ncbi:MAG: UDP-N-acetylglucosamine 1-carboxyvinyltransferase [bacterium]|nr:UDP-N-acetylglucosamine 1-carboxyvinyltransferase [bacterium]